MCIQVNTFKKTDYQLKTCNICKYIRKGYLRICKNIQDTCFSYDFIDFPLAGISKLMLTASVPEKPIINIKMKEETGRRNLPILQEEETFRIFGNIYKII
jgi:hypothetical protein